MSVLFWLSLSLCLVLTVSEFRCLDYRSGKGCTSELTADSVNIDVFIPNFRNAVWTCLNLITLHNGLSGNHSVRFTVLNMDDDEETIVNCAPSDVRVFHLVAPGKGGESLSAVFKAIPVVSSGQYIVVADSDAVNVAAGWDTTVVNIFRESPHLKIAGINPRGVAIRGEQSLFAKMVEWNWMVGTYSFLSSLPPHPSGGHGSFPDWGHYFVSLVFPNEALSWDDCMTVISGKSPTLCRVDPQGRPWVMHSFYLSRKHRDTNFDDSWVVTPKQELQLIHLVFNRFANFTKTISSV